MLLGTDIEPNPGLLKCWFAKNAAVEEVRGVLIVVSGYTLSCSVLGKNEIRKKCDECKKKCNKVTSVEQFCVKCMLMSVMKSGCRVRMEREWKHKRCQGV